MRMDSMKIFRFILMLVVAAWSPVFSYADVVDGIEAVVADKVITFAQVEEYTLPVEETLRTQYAAEPDVYQEKRDAALPDSLEVLVERALILHNYETGGDRKPPDSPA